MITSDEIKRRLWNGANELRGSMDALFPCVFHKENNKNRLNKAVYTN